MQRNHVLRNNVPKDEDGLTALSLGEQKKMIMRKVRFDHNKKVADTIPTETMDEELKPKKLTMMEQMLEEMIPLVKAGKNDKKTVARDKPPAWAGKPKPEPFKHVEHPDTYAGKKDHTLAVHEIEKLLEPIKKLKKDLPAGATLDAKSQSDALNTLDKKRKETLSKFLLMQLDPSYHPKKTYD